MGETRHTSMIRLPESLYRQLKAIADVERRSINGQIEIFVRDGVQRYGREHEQAKT